MGNMAYQDKITRSSHYQRILELWEQQGKDTTPKRFYEAHVQPLDPSLDYHAFWYWQKKYEAQKRQRIASLTNQAMEQGIDTAIDRQKVQNQIRDSATKLFVNKLQEFIANPDTLKGMTLREATHLYRTIREEEDRQRAVELKEQGFGLHKDLHDAMMCEWAQHLLGRAIYDHKVTADDIDEVADTEWGKVVEKYEPYFPALSSPESPSESLVESG